MSEVDLLEWAVRVPVAAGIVKQYLGLSLKDDPINVALEVLDWRRGNVQILSEEDGTVTEEFNIQIAKLKFPAIGIDDEGHRFLARKGDYLVRSVNNTYAVVKAGVR